MNSVLSTLLKILFLPPWKKSSLLQSYTNNGCKRNVVISVCMSNYHNREAAIFGK